MPAVPQDLQQRLITFHHDAAGNTIVLLCWGTPAVKLVVMRWEPRKILLKLFDLNATHVLKSFFHNMAEELFGAHGDSSLSSSLSFLDLEFGADTQGSQYDYNDFTLPSQTVSLTQNDSTQDTFLESQDLDHGKGYVVILLFILTF